LPVQPVTLEHNVAQQYQGISTPTMSSAREDIPFLLDGGSGYAQDVGAAAELRQMSRSSSPKGVTGAGVQLEPPPPWEDNPASRQQSAASPRSTGGFRPIELKWVRPPGTWLGTSRLLPDIGPTGR